MSTRKKKGFRLLPIFEPHHNFREICKQLVLLEDHLCHPRKRCQDCIRKHFVTAEALAEEAVSLAGAEAGDQELASMLAETLRALGVAYAKKKVSADKVAAAIRSLRKPLLKMSYEHVGPDKPKRTRARSVGVRRSRSRPSVRA